MSQNKAGEPEDKLRTFSKREKQKLYERCLQNYNHKARLQVQLLT